MGWWRWFLNDFFALVSGLEADESVYAIRKSQ